MIRGHGGGALWTLKRQRHRHLIPGFLRLVRHVLWTAHLPGDLWTHSTPHAKGFLQLGLDEQPTWPRCCQLFGGPASRPCSKRDRRCQSLWPSSGGLSWPKRDRYNSVLKDKTNWLTHWLTFQGWKRTKKLGETPICLFNWKHDRVIKNASHSSYSQIQRKEET